MINFDSIQKQKDEKFVLENQILPFLNRFKIEDWVASGEELEGVLIERSEENVSKLNEFLCTINCWAMIAPNFLCPAMKEFLREQDDDELIDLSIWVYGYLAKNKKINTDRLSFNTAEQNWVVH